jgi:hypothetical protein
VLPGPCVSAAPRCLALPHPTVAHRAPTSSRPTVGRCAMHRSRPPPPLSQSCPSRPRYVCRPPLSKQPRSAAHVLCWLTRCHSPARPSPLLSYPHAAPSRPPPSFFPRRSAPERVQKRWPSSCSPLCSAFLPRAQAHRRLPRPPLTRSIGLRRQDRNGPRHISDRRHRCPPPPPHGETQPSAAWQGCSN